MNQTNDNDNASQSDRSRPLVEIHPDLVNQWCCVKYRGDIYPGIITDVDEVDVEVNCMSLVGKCKTLSNRYYWPMFADKTWYSADDVLGLIPEPKKISKRHVEIDYVHFEELSKML